jgi:hypothetical protein
MKTIKTDIFGFGIAYAKKSNELLIHFWYCTYEFKL